MNNLSRFFLTLLVFFVLAGGTWYLYQSDRQAPEVPDEPAVVALPMIGFPTYEPLRDGFVQGMEDLGYEEGVHVEYRSPDEPITPNPQGMEEIRNTMRSYIEEGVDVIVTSSNPDAQVAAEEVEAANADTAIVSLDMFDPVEGDLVEGYESPGGNLTGIAERRADSVGRFLDLLTTIVPDTERLGVLAEGFIIPSDTAPATDFLQALRSQADEFGIELVEYTTNASGPESELRSEVVRVLDGVEEGEVDAFTHIPGHFVHDQQVLEHEMGLEKNIPVAMPATLEANPETGETVGLFAYGANFEQKGVQGASMTDKILRGTDPGELPVEAPVKYDLIINRNVAEEIGVEIPEEVLQLADQVIE